MSGDRTGASLRPALAVAVVLGVAVAAAGWLSWQHPGHVMDWLVLFSLCGA
jgi:hypothetical protein